MMATMFGLYPFLMKLYADGGYQGPLFRRAVAKIMERVNVEIVKRSESRKRICCPPEAVNVRMARAVQTSRQRLGESQSQGVAFLRLASNQAHAEKTMQSCMISPDRLLVMRECIVTAIVAARAKGIGIRRIARELGVCG
jgi:hypothetical protein